MTTEATAHPRPLFRVKICGVTTPDDARLAADAGADAVGLNFVEGSPRRVAVEVAAKVAAAVPAGVVRVGVFAGMSAEEILAIARTAGLDAIQLHGELGTADPPERCRELSPIPVIRAVRLEADGLDAARSWLQRAIDLGCPPAMMLVDATVARGTDAGRLGGSGITVDWQALARERPLGVPMALAGGLSPANVEEAVLATGPAAVDTASGVESGPGRKDPSKVREFVAVARRALGLPGRLPVRS